ncbi:MAG: hypothetical protein HQL73_02740 [Magnetococcales bacterium]|nr:hypothetical protein [Magnetococcales bacterium]
MTILSSELLLYKSAIVGSGGNNGGVMGTTLVANGVKNNIFPDVDQARRISGVVTFRKLFLKVANASNGIFANPKLYLDLSATLGGDRVLMFAGTQTNTQSDLTGSERLYGAGTLDVDVSPGGTSLRVNVQSAGDRIFRGGDTIRITDGSNSDYLTLAATDGVSWDGTLATLTLASGGGIPNSYAASLTRVASVLTPSDVEGVFDSWSGSSSAGTYGGNAPTITPINVVPILDWIGTIEQTWTFTFTSATTFVCVGDTVGSVGGGSSTANFAPSNADFSRPYLTLPASGWGGTWALGDTLTFKTHPAAVPVWLKRIVPPGATGLSGDRITLGWYGETS